MNLFPQIIVTGFTEDLEKKHEMSIVISLIEKEFSKMGIQILINPEHFTEKDIANWVKDISSPNDFYINIQEKEIGQVLFRTKKEKNMAQTFSKNLSQWTDSEFIDSTSIASQNGNIFNILAHLPLHSWNISLPNHLSEKEQVFSIIGCITELYTTKHSLISDENIWPFRDVPSSHFAFNAIKKAKERKIITGYKGDIFYPNGGITRGEVLYMLDKIGKL